MNKGTLYLVGLHIGNINDISPRSFDYIKKAKNIVIEREEAFERIWEDLNIDSSKYNIISIEYASNGGEPGISYEKIYTQKVIDLLNAGEDVYVIADEGMPGVADPGVFLVSNAIENGIKIVSTPGPSIAIAATAVTGTMHNFSFESFLPFTKEQRIQFLKDRKDNMYPMVIVLRNEIRDPEGRGVLFGNEIPEFLEECIDILGSKRNAALCYNLTMSDEKVVNGTIEYLNKYFNDTPRHRALITIVIDAKNGKMATYNDKYNN